MANSLLEIDRQTPPPALGKPGRGDSMHQQLRRWLTNELQHYAPDQKLPTEFELANRFKVSRLTVHKVMAELQRDGYLIRKRGRGSFVAPRDKRIHTNHSLGCNGSVLIAYPDWFSYDIWGKVESAERLAVKHGMHLLNCKITREAMYGWIEPLVNECDDLRGVIVVPPGGSLTPENLELFSRLEVPVVALVAVEEGALPDNVFAVSQDFRQMGRLDIDTLVQAGHRRIGYVAAEPWGHANELEYAGMKEALYEHGLLLRHLRRSERRIRPWEDSTHFAQELTRGMMRDTPPGALIFDSLPTAMAGLRTLWDLDPRLAQEIAVVINAAYFGFEQFLWPPVYVVTCDLHAIVSQAFELLTAPVPPSHRIWPIPVAATHRTAPATP